MVTFWGKFTFDVNDPPLPSQTDATDLLQVDGPSITDTEGDAFFVAIATLYNDLGLAAAATYLSMRGEINQEGEAASNAVFDILKDRAADLSDVLPVLTGLQEGFWNREIVQIDADILQIETDRDLKSTSTEQALIDAYNEGIAVLNARKDLLNDFLGN